MENRSQSDKLRDARESSGFTQQQVAAALNIDRSSYASYETGRSHPSLSTLVTLSRIFNVPMELLLDDELASNYVQDFSGDTKSASPFLAHNEHIYDLSRDEHSLLCLFRTADRDLQQKMIEQLTRMLYNEQKDSR